MSAVYELAALTIDFLEVFKLPNNEWYRQKIEELSDSKRLEDIERVAQQHELSLLKVRFEAEIERTRLEEERKTKDYMELLNNIEELKQKIFAAFPGMPKPMVYIIHHHAKRLLDEIWIATDEASRATSQSRFAEFLMAIYNDTANAFVSEQAQFPNETVKLIKGVSAYEINEQGQSSNAVTPARTSDFAALRTGYLRNFTSNLSLLLLVLREIFVYPLRDSVITSVNNNHKAIRN